MEKIKRNLPKLFFVAILEIIIISFVYAFFCQLVDNEMHYGVERSESDTVVIGEKKVTYPISFFENHLQSYKIAATASEEDGSWISFEILNEDGIILIQGKQSIAEISNNQAIIIDTTSVVLAKDVGYQLRMWGDGQATIEVQEFQGNLVGAETYNFMYQKQLMIFCILLVFLSVIILSIMVFGKSFWTGFLLLAVCINVLQNVASIPCSAPDDFRHFLRAYDIASGNIKCENYVTESGNKYGMIMPVVEVPVEYAELTDLTQESNDEWTKETNYKLFIPKWISLFQKNESDNMVECAMLATDKISPVAYVPQIIGIWLARQIGLAPILVYYMARCGNFLFSLVMIAFAIRLVPQRKLLFSVLYFVPGMNLLRASCSTDSVLYACVLLILALFLKLWDENKKMPTLKESMLIAMLTIVIGSIKLPYILTAGIFILLPMENSLKEFLTKENIGQSVKNAIITILICGSAYVVYRSSTSYFSYNDAELVASNITSYMFSNLLKVINLLLQFLFGKTFYFLQSGLCGQIAEAEFVSISYMCLICWVSGIECGKRELSGMVKKFVLCFVVGMTLVIYFVFFTISDPASGEIIGVQGRYLLPIFAVGSVALPKLSVKCEMAINYVFSYIFAAGITQVCCSFIFYFA